MFLYLLIIDINNCLFWFCKILLYHVYSAATIIPIDPVLRAILNYLTCFLYWMILHSLFASIYHAQLIAGSLMSNKKSVIKKICGLLLSRSWLARLARIWKGLLGIDRFNYSGCISVIVTARTVQNFIDEYHFTYRHVFVRRTPIK